MKKALALIMAVMMLVTTALPVMADQTDAAVQASYDAFVSVMAAIDTNDLSAFRTAAEAFEAANEQLDDEQTEQLAEMIEAGGNSFWSSLFLIAQIGLAADLYDAFVADPGAKTALEFTENYDLHFNDEEPTLGAPYIAAMIPGIEEAYQQALTCLPSEGVLAVYEAYQIMENALLFAMYDEDFVAAKENFEGVVDTFNELDEEDLAKLAELIDAENAEGAFSKVLSNWINMNVVYEMGQRYTKFSESSTKKNAASFLEYYNSLYNDPDYVDEALRSLVSEFFPDIEAAAEEARKAANKTDSSSGGRPIPIKPAAKTEEVEETNPDTGDNTMMVLPVAAMLAAAAVMAAARKRRGDVC